MEYGAIDLHKKESQIRIVTEGGDGHRPPDCDDARSLDGVFWGRPRMRILLEASTESEWVAQHLETLGHEVIVADPNFSAMYGHRSRRIKTDRRDVAALADACQRGCLPRGPPAIDRATHRASAAHHPPRAHGRTDARHLYRASDGPRRGMSDTEWQHGHVPRAWPPWRSPVMHDDALAFAQPDRRPESGARQGG